MCNPNCAAASRRYRLNQGAANHLLTQKLVGSLITTAPPKQTTEDVVFTPTPELELQNAAGYFADGDQPQKVQPSFFYQQSLQPTLAEDVDMKPKAKRRRKPQKPGLTAKGATRHFVEHHYHDHANDPEEDVSSDDTCNRRRGGVTVSFPLKLHTVLEQVEEDGFSHVISWQPHNRCFVIHKPKEFTEVVMPKYFRQSKLTSFQRQLNLYGFQRITRGCDSGGYYHELFLRGKTHLCKRMFRTKVKGTKFKAASSPDQEPNFYKMPPVVVTPHNSDCDNSEDGVKNGSYNADLMLTEKQEFQPPHHPFEHFSMGQPQEAPVCPIECNRLAMQTFGDIPSPPQLPSLHSSYALASPISATVSRDYVSSPLVASAPSIPAASSADFMNQAVDELFLEDSQSVTDVMDFVASWDDEFEGMGPVTNDVELGNLLDKILED